MPDEPLAGHRVDQLAEQVLARRGADRAARGVVGQAAAEVAAKPVADRHGSKRMPDRRGLQRHACRAARTGTDRAYVCRPGADCDLVAITVGWLARASMPDRLRHLPLLLPRPRGSGSSLSACGSDDGRHAGVRRRRAADRHDGRADHEHRRRTSAATACRSPASSRRGRTRTRSSPSRASPSCCRELDVLYVNGLKLEEPTKELAEENLDDGRARSSSSARSRSREASTPTTSRFRSPAASPTRTSGPTRSTR